MRSIKCGTARCRFGSGLVYLNHLHSCGGVHRDPGYIHPFVLIARTISNYVLAYSFWNLSEIRSRFLTSLVYSLCLVLTSVNLEGYKDVGKNPSKSFLLTCAVLSVQAVLQRLFP